MKTPIRIFCALLLAAAMLCVCLDWLGAPDGLPDGASFGTAVDPLLEDGSLIPEGLPSGPGLDEL